MAARLLAVIVFPITTAYIYSLPNTGILQELLWTYVISRNRGRPLCVFRHWLWFAINPFFSANLGVMWVRVRHVWGLVTLSALIAVLALAAHPGFAPRAASGMSAPPAPRTSIEAAPLDNFLQSHPDWFAAAPVAVSEPATFPVIRISVVRGFVALARPPAVALRQRPPPFLS
jgi:hypothetical protein